MQPTPQASCNHKLHQRPRITSRGWPCPAYRARHSFIMLRRGSAIPEACDGVAYAVSQGCRSRAGLTTASVDIQARRRTSRRTWGPAIQSITPIGRRSYLTPVSLRGGGALLPPGRERSTWNHRKRSGLIATKKAAGKAEFRTAAWAILASIGVGRSAPTLRTGGPLSSRPVPRQEPQRQPAGRHAAARSETDY